MMKIMLLALLFPVFCAAQNEKATSVSFFQDSIPKTSFYLKDRRIVFQKVYTSSLKQKELANQLYSQLNLIDAFKYDSDGNSDAIIQGQLCQYRFGTERYGVTVFNAPVLLQYPIDARVTIQVKDYKYRVTVAEIAFRYFGADGKLDELLERSLMEKDGKKFKNTQAATKMSNYLHLDFSDLFDVRRSATASEF